ncbi:MAG: hypothetical protein M3P04_09535 [Actinomycetota bacterium]|nr:hypothetical protein [Actinomycetota bacterium]
MRLSHVPLRVTTGAFILNAGWGKRSLPPEAAAGMQRIATSAFPQLADVSPATFGKAMAAGEMAVGLTLLAPFVSPVVAGAALAAFSGGLLRMATASNGTASARSAPEKDAIAREVWMLGTGLALVTDGLSDGARRTAKRTGKAARRQAKAVRSALPVP